MSDEVHLTGMVLSSVPYAEYDRRIILLTRERGKITAFAKGARKPTSALLAAAGVFHFGDFTLYEGRNAYTLAGASISRYFSGVREDLDKSLLASYFMELAGYYGRENLDAKDMLNLLYVTLGALEQGKMDLRLIRYIFEIRLIAINGEYPVQVAGDETLDPSTRYTLTYILQAPLQKLYAFTVNEKVLTEITALQERLRPRIIDMRLKSLEILEQMQPHSCNTGL